MDFGSSLTFLSLFVLSVLGIYGMITLGTTFRYWLVVIILLFLVVGLN